MKFVNAVCNFLYSTVPAVHVVYRVVLANVSMMFAYLRFSSFLISSGLNQLNRQDQGVACNFNYRQSGLKTLTKNRVDIKLQSFSLINARYSVSLDWNLAIHFYSIIGYRHTVMASLKELKIMLAHHCMNCPLKFNVATC